MKRNEHQYKLKSFEEAGALFDDMTAKIKNLSEVEREADCRRSPFVKMLGWLCLMSALIAAGVGAYGIYNLPYAPIRERGGAYYGRYDTPSTKADYEKHQIWSKAFFISFGVTFTLGFSFVALDSRERKRNKLPV